jgi:hypothetical protein
VIVFAAYDENTTVQSLFIEITTQLRVFASSINERGKVPNGVFNEDSGGGGPGVRRRGPSGRGNRAAVDRSEAEFTGREVWYVRGRMKGIPIRDAAPVNVALGFLSRVVAPASSRVGASRIPESPPFVVLGIKVKTAGGCES